MVVPVVDAQFDTFEQYYEGIFASGQDSSTYSPVNPQSDDPVAVKSRGLYFDGTSFLKLMLGFQLNYKITITSWSMAQSLRSIINSNAFIISTAPCAMFVLSSSNAVTQFITGICYVNPNVWNFNQLTIGFSAETTTISLYQMEYCRTLDLTMDMLFIMDIVISKLGLGLLGFSIDSRFGRPMSKMFPLIMTSVGVDYGVRVCGLVRLHSTTILICSSV